MDLISYKSCKTGMPLAIENFNHERVRKFETAEIRTLN